VDRVLGLLAGGAEGAGRRGAGEAGFERRVATSFPHLPAGFWHSRDLSVFGVREAVPRTQPAKRRGRRRPRNGKEVTLIIYTTPRTLIEEKAGKKENFAHADQRLVPLGYFSVLQVNYWLL